MPGKKRRVTVSVLLVIRDPRVHDILLLWAQLLHAVVAQMLQKRRA